MPYNGLSAEDVMYLYETGKYSPDELTKLIFDASGYTNTINAKNLARRQDAYLKALAPDAAQPTRIKGWQGIKNKITGHSNIDNTRKTNGFKNYTPNIQNSIIDAGMTLEDLTNAGSGAASSAGSKIAKEATEEATEQAAKKTLGQSLKGAGSKFAQGMSHTTKNFFNPQAGGWVSYGWTPGKSGGWGKTGLNIGGQNIGKWGTIGAGVMQGLDALGGMSEMSKQNADIDDLESQILASAAGNPLISSYLTSEDLSLLGKLQRGNYEGNAGIGDAFSNIGNIISGAGSGALTGAIGGLPGILVGGIGGAINAGIDNMNSTGSQNTARLEALYQNLLDAEQQYKAMKRPNFTGLGIQQRYQNMYI